MGETNGTASRGLPFIPAALDDLGLDVFEFRLYCHAARRAGADGRFYGGGTKVAKACRMSLRRLRQALARLRNAGLLEAVEEERGRSTTYRVHPCTTCTGAPRARVAGREPVHHVHRTSAPGALLPVHHVHTEGTPLKVLPEGTPLTRAPRARVRGGWPATLAETWRPFGEVNPGRLGKALGGVVREHGLERTETGLRRWLEAGNGRFGPEVFARDAVGWIRGNGTARANGTRAERVDAQVSASIRRARQARAEEHDKAELIRLALDRGHR